MTFTKQRKLRGAGPMLAAETLARPRVQVAILGATLGLGVAMQAPASAADMAKNVRVGHTVNTVVVPGSTLCPDPVRCHYEDRRVDVHLWYPADVKKFAGAPKTVYQSALHGLNDDKPGNPPNPLIPGRWDPLSWQVESEVAREAPIDRNGPALPVIVFSHGSTNDPIDYAQTLELIAGAGFVVAAPAHVNNTQDDVRIDFINDEAKRATGDPQLRLFTCRDGRPSPCSRGNVARSMEDRVRDISYTLDKLDKDKVGHWSLAERVDKSQVGVMGHSRGTVTALAAAGGSRTGTNETRPWGFDPEPRVKAVMGLAIGGRGITFGADLAQVEVPTLLVAGQGDQNSTPDVSEDAFTAIKSEKAYVSITNAVHRSFDSSYCDELKSAGVITQAAGTNSYGERKALLDGHTVQLIGTSFPGGRSGMAHEYCSADTFRNPDITELMTSFNNGTFTFDGHAPTTGLETNEVKDGVKELAVTFFGTVLKRVGNDGPHFTEFLSPKWLEKHEPMVGAAEAVAGRDGICPPGQDVTCAD